MNELILNTNSILLILIMVLINSTMDKIRFRYSLTLWSKMGADWWFNPAKSWKNKHKWKPTWLFRTVLVWTTDFWHLLKFLMLNVIFVWVVVLSYGEFNITAFIAFWLFWGLIFEMNYNVKVK